MKSCGLSILICVSFGAAEETVSNERQESVRKSSLFASFLILLADQKAALGN
jgi:hypothetical protein